MTIEELFKQQNPQDGEIPKWAKDLSELYAEAKAKEFAEWLHENWNAKYGGWSAKKGDINTLYSAKVLYETFKQSK